MLNMLNMLNIRTGRRGHHENCCPFSPSFLSPLAVLLVHDLLYNPIGDLAGQRGTDFSPFITTPLDALVPYVPVFVLPYLFSELVFLVVLLRREQAEA